jgi:hypothetical protein
LLVELYGRSDGITRGNIVQAASRIGGGEVIGKLLAGALADQSVCEDPELITGGSALRVCDAAYNQLVLRHKVKGVLRTISSVYPIPVRDYHIGVLKTKLEGN